MLKANLDLKNEECIKQKIKTSEAVNKLVVISASMKPGIDSAHCHLAFDHR
jgi:hypothetical protein